MATDTLQDIPLTNQWQEITATVPTSASIDLMIQNVGTSNIQLVQGGASAPTESKTGRKIPAGQDAYVNNARLWVRSYTATGGLISLNPL